MWSQLVLPLLALSTSAAAAPARRQTEEYEYIVVGSGAGGGPLAARLARAGHKTLLIEAGADQVGNDNTTIPAFQAVSTQDDKMKWDIYVNHYQDQERAKQDPKYTYDIGNGETYSGFFPPEGAKPLGILYPRAQVLGGCVTHNALVWNNAADSDWNHIAEVTGDESFLATNMNQYLDKVYEWQRTNPTDPTILLRDNQLLQQLGSGAAEMGLQIPVLDLVTGLANTLLVDPNARFPGRDGKEGLYQIPLIGENGERRSVRERILDTVKGNYSLTVKTNTFVTKVDFDTSGAEPKATGVSFLEGPYLYKANPLANGQGTPGSVRATKEVILSGGAYNTVQMLKLSGIGPEEELDNFDIPVIANLPGVGRNLQEHYEIGTTITHERDFALLDGCTFDAKDHDECYKTWKNNPTQQFASRGAYASNGLAAVMAVNSASADNSDIDLNIFGAPINFTGYFPYWGDDAVKNHNNFAWYTLKGHTRNKAGTVELRSADPLDTPIINFNYFDTGTTDDGADQKDLASIVEGVKKSRSALSRYRNELAILGGSDFKEVYPGPEVQTDEEIATFVKNRAWGHHASCTAAIGPDGDELAVLDSKFRVRGVQGLRVVDASSFPRIPGVFPMSPIMVLSEKAADVIIKGE